MSVGIFFFTAQRFGWGPGWNFALAAAQGAVYVPAALLAGRLAARVPHWRALAGVYTALALIAGIGVVVSRSPVLIAALLLAYTFVIGLSWPILEGLVASGVDAAMLARRVALYNLIWPATGAAAVAVEGAVIQHWPAGVFLLPALAHLGGAILVLIRPDDRQTIAPRGFAVTETGAAAAAPAADLPPATAHVEPEPQLLRVRTRALWISRLALPATYAVIYGLMPLMPAILARQHIVHPTTQTLVSSTWLAARWLSFALLAATAWWHTRPRAMVAAAALMLVAFLGITLPPTLFFHTATPAWDVAALFAWQLLLGLSLGMIYSGSLYFGMVLSEGSTEHGGYHEALIGLGWVLGPAAGAITQVIRPGDLTAGVIAVGGVIGCSVLAVAVAAFTVGRNRE